MKVLIVLSNLRVANGVAAVVMNQYDALISHGFRVDFMQFLEFDSPYVDKIRVNGGKIYTIGKSLAGILRMMQILRREKYDILHINQMNAETVILAAAAHRLGVKKVLYHSHNTKIPGGRKRAFLEKCCNTAYLLFADRLAACSGRAGRDSFGQHEFTVIRNAIDVKQFQFNRQNRADIRKENGISEDTFVVGTVCRYAGQKNPLLMIDIMDNVIKKRPDSCFLWVGSAPREDDPVQAAMEARVRDLGIGEHMKWAGSRSDVSRWYSAMDAFLMPSKWEGLGITYMEAQANGLPAFASDVVPEETGITPLISYHSLTEKPEKWAEEICRCPVRNEMERVDYRRNFTESGYDLESAADQLLLLYKELME